MKLRVWPGRPYPLGATWDGSGTNFAIYSEHATGVELCLFDSPDSEAPTHTVKLVEQTDMVWHAYLPDALPGQAYGYRVDGPYNPAEGHRFNRNKVLLDPYAKAIARQTRWSDELWGYKVGDPKADLSFDERDNAKFAPLAAVVDEAFTWGDDRPPNTSWSKTLIYEVHVKGFTKLHEEVPENLRGTYGGLASDAAIRYLRNLGVTAVELLPVHEPVDDRHLVDRGLVNYWGYNTLGFFAPASRYASVEAAGDVVREFKMMVRNLHAAGIEVILDVVYNHTAEGNHLGPTLSFRGIDNASYYRLSPEDSRYYMDFTGCGNTFHMRNPRVLQLVMDSLRYWITHMHVDGFRFDLASTLARELHEVDKLGAFFDIIHQDPVISVTRSATSPCCGRNGMANIATRSAVSGKETVARFPSSPPGSAAPAICMSGAAVARTPASILSRPTMASPSTIWCRTTKSTMKPMASRTAMAATTTRAGIAARRGRPRIRPSRPCAKRRSAAFWPRSSCRKARL